LDPEWRDPAGRVQKGNNGFRRPYIRPQSAGSWISGSRGVKPSRSVKVPSEQSVKQVIYEGVTSKRVVGSSAVGSIQDRHVETFGVGTSGISELRHKWLSSGRHHTAKSRRLFSKFVPTTPWRVARRVCQRQTKEAYDVEPSASGGKLSETQCILPDQAGPGVTDERWIDFRFQEAFAWRALRLPAKFPNSNRQLPECQNTELLVTRQRRGHRQRR